MARLLASSSLLVALAVPAPALAQSGAFGPLPPADADAGADGRAVERHETAGRQRPAVDAAADRRRPARLLFVVIGRVIMRDARRTCPSEGLRRGLREEGPHKHKRQAKAKARAQGPRPRAARKRRSEIARHAPGGPGGGSMPLPAHAVLDRRVDGLDDLDARVALGVGLDQVPGRPVGVGALDHVLDARSYSWRFSRLRQSSSVSFQRFSGSVSRAPRSA